MNFPALYRKYDDELWSLAKKLRLKQLEFSRQGHIAAFGDVEGEIMYLAVRELRPDCVFEISPAAGYSTNYILAALTANDHGRLHAFDINGDIHGRPTDSVIRENLMKGLDASRLEVHIGDARETTPQVEGTVQFCLLDSCHEDWFAKWYIETILPRVNGLVMIQDICFCDRLEKSSEAKHVWQWLKEERVYFELVGAMEEELRACEDRPNLPDRRPQESNSLLLSVPLCHQDAMPELTTNPEDLLQLAEQSYRTGDVAIAEDHLLRAEELVWTRSRRVNRHRLYLKIADLYFLMDALDLSEKYYHHALGEVMCYEEMGRAKGLREMWRESKARHSWLRWFTSKRNRKPNARRFRLAWTVLANVLCDRWAHPNAWKPRPH